MISCVKTPKCHNSILIEQNSKIILYKTQYEGDLMHVDYLSIPGANLNTLTNAFKYEYQEKPFLKPLDVVLIGGYNDILEGCVRT